MTIRKRRTAPPEPVAGNGLLDRRALLGRGIVFAGATTTGVGTLLTGAAAEPLFKPSLALSRQGVTDQRLDVGDVWKMSDSDLPLPIRWGNRGGDQDRDEEQTP